MEPQVVVSATTCSDGRVSLQFASGQVGVLDLTPLTRGPVFDRLRAEGLEAAFELENGTLTWAGGIDVCPDVLHDEMLRQQGLPSARLL
jgi:hypothetical protein